MELLGSGWDLEDPTHGDGESTVATVLAAGWGGISRVPAVLCCGLAESTRSRMGLACALQ